MLTKLKKTMLFVILLALSPYLLAKNNNIVITNQLNDKIHITFNHLKCIAPHNENMNRPQEIASRESKSFKVHGTSSDCEAESSGENLQVPSFDLHITSDNKTLSTRCSYWATGASETSWHYQCTPSKGNGISITSTNEDQSIALNICKQEEEC